MRNTATSTHCNVYSKLTILNDIQYINTPIYIYICIWQLLIHSYNLRNINLGVNKKMVRWIRNNQNKKNQAAIAIVLSEEISETERKPVTFGSENILFIILFCSIISDSWYSLFRKENGQHWCSLYSWLFVSFVFGNASNCDSYIWRSRAKTWFG